MAKSAPPPPQKPRPARPLPPRPEKPKGPPARARVSAIARDGTRSAEYPLFKEETRIGAQVGDDEVKLDEPRRETDLRHVAGTRQVDRELADGAGGGAGRKHDDAIRERDRFLEIVRDEKDALAVGAP